MSRHKPTTASRACNCRSPAARNFIASTNNRPTIHSLFKENANSMKPARTTNALPELYFYLTRLSVLALIGCLFLAETRAAQLGTAFTYSGRLKYKNNPADGNFDLQIKLYDDATAGNLVGTTSINSLAIA